MIEGLYPAWMMDTQRLYQIGNLFGPNELLLDGGADLIIHHIDKTDSRYEYRDFCKVQVVPVIAPGIFKYTHQWRIALQRSKRPYTMRHQRHVNAQREA